MILTLPGAHTITTGGASLSTVLVDNGDEDDSGNIVVVGGTDLLMNMDVDFKLISMNNVNNDKRRI